MGDTKSARAPGVAFAPAGGGAGTLPMEMAADEKLEKWRGSQGGATQSAGQSDRRDTVMGTDCALPAERPLAAPVRALWLHKDSCRATQTKPGTPHQPALDRASRTPRWAVDRINSLLITCQAATRSGASPPGRAGRPCSADSRQRWPHLRGDRWADASENYGAGRQGVAIAILPVTFC